jgi:hypothetical protein
VLLISIHTLIEDQQTDVCHQDIAMREGIVKHCGGTYDNAVQLEKFSPVFCLPKIVLAITM